MAQNDTRDKREEDGGRERDATFLKGRKYTVQSRVARSGSLIMVYNCLVLETIMYGIFCILT